MAFKHRELYETLAETLRRGEIPPGGRLPTEKELRERYGISRITAARALKDLERDGLVQRVAGKGTFAVSGAVRENAPFHLLAPSLSGKYYSEMADEFLHFFYERGVLGVALVTRYDRACTVDILEKIMGATSGVALIPSGAASTNGSLLAPAERFAKEKTLVIGSREMEGFGGPQVVVDEEKAGYDAAAYLIGLGRRRLLYAGSRNRHRLLRLRSDGFFRACREHGLPEGDAKLLEDSDLIAIHQARELFYGPDRPDGVVAASESHALKTYDLLSSIGVKIPEEAALVSLDGGMLAASVEAPLTTIDFPGGEIGRLLAETLWKGHVGEKVVPGVIKISAPLIVRSSCGGGPRRYRHEYLRPFLDCPR